MVIFLCNIYITYLFANMVFALDPSNIVVKWLWCTQVRAVCTKNMDSIMCWDKRSIYLFFLSFLHQNVSSGYSLAIPLCGNAREYPLFWCKNDPKFSFQLSLYLELCSLPSVCAAAEVEILNPGPTEP